MYNHPISTSGCVQSCIERWQARLGLQDWDVRGRFAKAQEIDSVGLVDFHVEKKCATIIVLSPDQYPHFCEMFPYDIEEVIVHELLHLLFAPIRIAAFPGDTEMDAVYQLFEEQAVDVLSRKLLKAVREAYDAGFRKQT